MVQKGKTLVQLMGLDDTASHTVIRALSTFDQVRHLLNELLEEATEGSDDEVGGSRAIETAITIQSIVADMADTLRGVAAQNAGLLQMNLELAEQRNEAIQRAESTVNDLVANVAATLGCSEEQAWKVLVAVSNPDEEVMEMDICDLNGLLQFREQLTAALEHLGYRDEE